DLLTTTPSFAVSSTSVLEPTSDLGITDVEPDILKPTYVISPSQSVSFGPSTSVVEVSSEDSQTSTTPMTTTKSTTSKYPNRGPSIHKRIQKLSLTAGKYWRYYIPSETFFDSGDGNTRSLKLTFLIFDLHSDREDSPPADYWIQFDHENQYSFALPTEKNVGKHKFTLVAVDSKGEPVTELLEVHVRQHPSSRAFHHTFTLYHVRWDSYKYPLLIEAVSKLARKVVRVFGDNNLNSFTVQSIEHSESTFTVSWTNSSLPAYPCPKEIIHSLYGKIADLTKPTEGISANPSRYLYKVTFPEFEIQ
ncbi:dystroglycan-like protein, partial [Leptotrombidium deliense]